MESTNSCLNFSIKLHIGLDLRDLPISLIRYDRPTKSENMIILLL